MSDKPKMNKSLLGGGLALLILGSFLSFGGFGLLPGSGGGGTDEGSDDAQISTVSEEESTSNPPKQLPEDGVIDIVIDERQYLVKEAGGKRSPMSLEAIGLSAKNTPGNSEGIKVRIARKKSALYSAERKLEESLEAMGLGPESVLWITEPVD